MPSKIWSISTDSKRAVPRNSMCSIRWLSPASGSASAADPVPIQKPSATERTLGIRSVMTRTPESSSVIRCSSSNCRSEPRSRGRPRITDAGRRGREEGGHRGAAGRCVARWRSGAVRRRRGESVAAAGTVAVPAGAVARAAGAARAAVAVAVAPALAARAAVAAGTAAVPAAADGGELLDGLAGDLRVLGEAQADAAALAVDLDHADADLVALVEDVLDRVHALAGRHVGDVQQAVGALGQLDEGAERRGLDDLRVRELVADLDVLEHRGDPVRQLLAQLAVGRVDEHLTVVVDVDLGLELLREAADRLAALADQHADLATGRSAA